MFYDFIRKNYDWILAACTALLVIVVAILAGAIYINSQTASNLTEMIPPQDQRNSSFYRSEPPDPKYPPPAKKQRNFYQTYDAGNIQYELQWTNRNIDRKSIVGPHNFRLVLYNSLNREVAIDAEQAKAMTVGCIAVEKPYRAQKVESETITFGPYEKKNIDFAINVSCMYLGTADGKYFWRIY